MVSVPWNWEKNARSGCCGVVVGRGLKKGGQAVELVLAFKNRGVGVFRDDHVVDSIRVVCRCNAGLDRRLKGIVMR
jgi:hypothetical protein